MSHAALRTLARPAARVLTTPRVASCNCRPALPQRSVLAPVFPSLLVRSYASKKSKGKKGAVVVEEDDEPAPAKGKGGKKGKGKSFAEEEVASGGGEEVRFDLKAVEASMDESVDKLRVGLKSIVGRVGRVSPDLLNGVKVESEGQRRPLGEFATVSVKDGKDLLVTVYEESYLKAVSQALYASSLNLAPQAISATSLRVPVPRADWEKRQQLVRQASELCENARVAVRSARTKGQKDLKSDIDAKSFSKDEGRSETKRLDTSTKKRTDEVDSIFEQAKKVSATHYELAAHVLLGPGELAVRQPLARSFWPLDGPTNYLDRESLAALIAALKTFEGGVLVITHNREFSESICSEVWAMNQGYLEASGHNWVEGQGSGPRIDKQDDEEKEVFDAMGNKIVQAKKSKAATSSELRKKKKERMARKKAGLPSEEEEEL